MSRLNVGNLFNENEDGAPVVSGISTFSSPNYFVPPSGTTAQRPQNPGEGMIRFNTDSGHLEYYTGELWADVIVNSPDLDGGTRGLIGGGFAPANTDAIEYFSIASSATSQDFGNLVAVKANQPGCLSSRERGIWGGGQVPGIVRTIDFVTIASTGDAADFGDLLENNCQLNAVSNQTRGVFMGGYQTPTINRIQYITIASTGDAVDFASLSIILHCKSCGSSLTSRGNNISST
jgi:hypothetical protein